ncbi:MICOS complex subunit Mic27 [Astyanax mexicanus]|uniref:MICOS complex subunit Mic27 n=1 Tax=Astyanax mexicanus TaxID=7994 RepID=UPI0020CB3A11|nr:MICOS complex subunit Mic27 [Astyanax mexicanus]
MSFKVVKVVAVPVVLGFASIRVYTMSEPKTEHLLLPRELTIYSTESQERLHYVDEQPGALQRGLGKVRGGLQSAFLNVKGAYVSAKSTAVNLYHGGEDIYHFLKDPPSGFVPRVALITVSGLAGVILARKGSRLKRLALPLSMITAGFAVCYPVQTISTLKVSGKRIYAASTWTSSTVSSLWKSPASSEPTKETEAAGTEESSQEVPPPTEPSLIPMPEAEAAPNPVLSVSISETEQTVPSVEEELLVKSDEEKTAAAAASSSSDETKPETSLQSSTEAETATVVAEKRNPGVDPSLMDFGQSNPEDADLYSTRS